MSDELTIIVAATELHAALYRYEQLAELPNDVIEAWGCLQTALERVKKPQQSFRQQMMAPVPRERVERELLRRSGL